MLSFDQLTESIGTAFFLIAFSRNNVRSDGAGGTQQTPDEDEEGRVSSTLAKGAVVVTALPGAPGAPAAPSEAHGQSPQAQTGSRVERVSHAGTTSHLATRKSSAVNALKVARNGSGTPEPAASANVVALNAAHAAQAVNASSRLLSNRYAVSNSPIAGRSGNAAWN